jgi:hypothetical protein
MASSDMSPSSPLLSGVSQVLSHFLLFLHPLSLASHYGLLAHRCCLVFLTMNPKMVSQIQIWLAESNINWKA